MKQYQSYSHNTHTYGVIFSDLEKAKDHTQRLSAIYKCRYDVADRETRGIIATYECGKVIYDSAGV